MIQIHPYNLGSRSAKALKNYLTEQNIRAFISHRLRSNRKRMIVGWGSKPLEFQLGRNAIVNPPDVTRILSCKKRFFEYVSGLGDGNQCIPEFTSDPAVASGWGDTVVVRSTTTGSGGDGISLIDVGGEIPVAPLYTRYQKKTHEYRLHILGGEIKEIQRKVFVKTEEKPEPDDWRIRNHTKGFIFQTEATCPDRVSEGALSIASLFDGLDFVAMDVIYHQPTDKAYVLEGNTAPGLEGPRLSIYGDYLISKYKEVM